MLISTPLRISVFSVFAYVAETGTVKAKDKQCIDRFGKRCSDTHAVDILNSEANERFHFPANSTLNLDGLAMSH